jgi:hypothetical protein
METSMSLESPKYAARVMYRFAAVIKPYGPTAGHKGSIDWSLPRDAQFCFLAPNVDSAYNKLRHLFKPEDPRPLHGYKRLELAYDRVSADPRDVFLVFDSRGSRVVAALNEEEAFKCVGRGWSSRIDRIGPYEPPDGVVDTKPFLIS